MKLYATITLLSALLAVNPCQADAESDAKAALALSAAATSGEVSKGKVAPPKGKVVSLPASPKVSTSNVSPAEGGKSSGQRQARGHTHTCHRCNITWDHVANPTHNCEICGRTQTSIDQPSRPVTILR